MLPKEILSSGQKKITPKENSKIQKEIKNKEKNTLVHKSRDSYKNNIINSFVGFKKK